MKLSIVSTLYFSADYIEEFYQRITKTASRITDDYEIIFVNDGSPDHVLALALALRSEDKKVKIVDLSKNFGHHKAMMTGLDYSLGELVFLIDVDLEEDPELLDIFYDTLQDNQGVDVVYGVQETRKGGWFERFSGSLFYKLFNLLLSFTYPANTLTARLMTRRYVEAITLHKEKQFDLWALFHMAGFKQYPLTCQKGSKGSSVYSLRKKFMMALTMIVSSSSKPLFYVGLIGMLITISAMIFVFYAIFLKIYYGIVLEGWTSLIISIWLVGGLNMFGIGVLGLYIATLYYEVKNRPVSIIKDYYG